MSVHQQPLFVGVWAGDISENLVAEFDDAVGDKSS